MIREIFLIKYWLIPEVIRPNHDQNNIRFKGFKDLIILRFNTRRICAWIT